VINKDVSEKIEDTKCASRNRNTKNRQYNGRTKKDKQWSTLLGKIKI